MAKSRKRSSRKSSQEKKKKNSERKSRRSPEQEKKRRFSKKNRFSEEETSSKGNPKKARHRSYRSDEKRDRGRSQRRNQNPSGPIQKYRARFEKNRRGFGFINFDTKEFEDVFVPPPKAAPFFHGDRLEVSVTSGGAIVDIQVLEHQFREVVGRFFSTHGAFKEVGLKKRMAFSNSGIQVRGWMVYERKQIREEIAVTSLNSHSPGNGEWVHGKLHFHQDLTDFDFPAVTAEITQVFGDDLPASSDIDVIAGEFNLIEEHSEEAKAEARNLKLEVPGKDLEGRKDLREVPFITIDGETARDFDDAVFVEKEGKDYILWVAIADVSHYVQEGAQLDEEAYDRATSVYFPERAFHMLPRELSENLCSLRPNEPRLAMTARMKFSPTGKLLDTAVFESVIQSQRRATYTEIQEESENNQNQSDWKFSAHFELYQILRQARTQRGSIDFDLPEAAVLVDNQGEPTEIVNRERKDAHRLIEEFMIAANEAVTRWVMQKHYPFVYRVHEEPTPEALDKFKTLAESVGFRLELKKGPVTPLEIAGIVEQMKGNPAEGLLNMALLRSLKQAVYSADHGIHFGLASEAYTHFTSPIRRYPDLLVHRVIRLILRNEKESVKFSENARDELHLELTGKAEHSSYRERLAAEAERQSIRIKQVRLMKRHLGDEFEGFVNGLNKAGLFIQIESPYVEGVIDVDSLGDDLYQFNEDQMILYGKRTRNIFKMGDRVRIQVVRADLERRQVIFELKSRIESERPRSSKK